MQSIPNFEVLDAGQDAKRLWSQNEESEALL